MTQALRPLADLLQQAATQLQQTAVPAALEAPTLRAMQAALVRPAAPPATARAAWHAWMARWAGWWRPMAWSGATSCALMLLGATWLMSLEPPARSAAPSASDFLPLVSAERWAGYLNEAGEGHPAWLVATEMPRERLALLGLPFDPARAGQPVRAELLMQASGEVLAVRFLR